MPEGSFGKARAGRAPKGSCSSFPLVLCCNKGRCGLLDRACLFAFAPSHHKMAAPCCLRPASCTARPGSPRHPAGKTPKKVLGFFFPLATPICRKKVSFSTPAAPRLGSSSVPSHRGNGCCAEAHRPLPLPSWQPSPSGGLKCKIPVLEGICLKKTGPYTAKERLKGEAVIDFLPNLA